MFKVNSRGFGFGWMLILGLTLFVGQSMGVWAQSSIQSRDLSQVILTLSEKQQASLGVRVGMLVPAQGIQWSVSASVVVPPEKQFTITAPYAGQISRLMVGLGDSFKAGAPLAQFVSPALGEVRRLLAEAQIDFKNSKAAAQRDQALFDEGIIPAVRLQLSLSKQEASLAMLQSRQAELNASGLVFESNAGYSTGTLKSPIDGSVVEAFTSVGQRLEPGALLFKIADTSSLQLELQLSPEKAAQLHIGDEVTMPSHAAKAKIVAISRSVDPSQMSKARAVVITKGRLQAGDLVTVNVTTKAKPVTTQPNAPGIQNIWLIPSRALTQFKGRQWLFLANEKGFVAHSVNVLSASEDTSTIECSLPTNARAALTGVSSLLALIQKEE